MRYLSFIILISAILCSCQPNNKPVEIESPSGILKAYVIVDEVGEIFYQIVSKTQESEKIIIEESPLGLVRSDADFTHNLRLKEVYEVKNVSDDYSMSSGKFSNLSYSAHEIVLSFVNESEQEMQIVFRVFDEGVAFRYLFSGESREKFTVKSESTSFNIGAGFDAWMSPYQAATSWGNPGYEADYLTVKSGTLSTEKVGWSFPLLFKKDNKWVFISEAGLDATYCGTHLNHDCSEGIYSVSFPEANERLGDGEVVPSSVLPWKLPWRFILVGDSLNKIVESSMVYHLSKPTKVNDTSWIKPGRASWEWWSSKGGRTVKALKQFIDLSAEMSWEYSLVDAGWENMPDGTIDDVIDYAHKKDVGLLFWYTSGGRRDSSKRSEDFVMFNDDTREQEMTKLEKLGIKGIKVDFFATDKQIAIELYEKIMKDAAKHKLLVNFHGCTLPRGWTRTYPNLLTMEAVRGAECYRFSKTYPEIASEYNTIAPILRSTTGPADYTPATFSDNRYAHKTTYGHELALTIIYESGIIHMADKPEGYQSLPKEAVEFLKIVPAAWDESRLIKAIPGELFIVARRKGSKWFVAGINGKNDKQEIEISLPDGLGRGIFVGDGEKLDNLDIRKIEKDNNSFSIEMMPNGGFIIF